MSTTDLNIAQAGQLAHDDRDDSQDREQNEVLGNNWSANGVAACLAKARGPNGSASASKRAEMARQQGDSAAPQGEHVAFRSPPEQAHAIREIETRFLGSIEDRVTIATTTDGRH